MAIAEEAEKGSHGEGGGGRGASAESQRGADTSHPPLQKKGMENSGRVLIWRWNHHSACVITTIVFPTINCRKFSVSLIPRSWGEDF